MKPIETRYKGYRFRSRLEARWAVFFDALGTPYEYEPEGYATDAGAYLPDFLLASRVLVEIKPQAFVGSAAEQRDLARWVGASGAARIPLLTIYGPPDRGNNNAITGWWGMRHAAFLVGCELGCCRRCGRFGFSHEDVGYELFCHPECAGDRWPEVTPDYIAAVEASRAARFEFGESGVPIPPRPLPPNDPMRLWQVEMDDLDRQIALRKTDIDELIRKKVDLLKRKPAHYTPYRGHR